MTDLSPIAPWSQDPDAEEGLKTRFGENVRLLRAHAHISQEELASRADVHRTQITFFESGQRMPRLGTVLKLAGRLGGRSGDPARRHRLPPAVLLRGPR